MPYERHRLHLRTLALALVAAAALLAGPVAGAQAACTSVKAAAYDNPSDKNDSLAPGDPNWAAQSFTLSSPITLTKVALYLANNGTSQNLVVEIHSDDSSKPGPLLASHSALFTNTAFAFDEFDFSADNLSLAAGVPYYVVAHHPSAGYSWGTDTSTPAYSGGSRFYSTNSGVNWTSDQTTDFLFQVFSQTCTPDPVQQGGGGNTPLALAAASHLTLSNDAFAAESSGPPATNARKRKAPLGTRVSYTLNEVASVRFTVKRKSKGRKVKRKGRTRCVKPTRKNRLKRKCTRLVALRAASPVPGWQERTASTSPGA